jgi:hypothetical protein
VSNRLGECAKALAKARGAGSNETLGKGTRG